MADPPSHFFKFIRPGFKFNLSIPKSFSRNLNNGGREKATLRRGHREWLVDLSDEGVFGDGWSKFVIENGVQEFDFIVFKHQGNMVFDFLVFDQSTCERQYPNYFDGMDVEEPLTESDSTYTDERSKKLKKLKKNDVDLSQIEDKVLVDDDHFVIIMRTYNIKVLTLRVPNKFARSHSLINRMNTRIILVDEKRRTTWPAMLKTTSSGAHLRFSREFKVKNHLEAGDVCMFKIAKNGEVPVFNFYIQGKKPVTENDHRCFISTVKSYFKKAGMYLPVEFSISNGLKVGKMVIRNDKGRSWKVQLNSKSWKSFYLGSGFGAFCMENGLREGDVLKFELVEKEKRKSPVLKFSMIGESTPSNGTVARASLEN